ncbi:helix-turn-helix domain-containing protein [Streptomyces sp. NPDC088768]|uniref:helix-turn-helix domain-containing protein n=1 Tax=Streptomyces sp. NPDC088768 TaxID=3365894 RepID=UPI003807D682
MENLGAKVRHYRQRGGRSQAVIAGLCGISDRYLSLIENGRAEPSLAVLTSLAAELGVPVGALLDGPQPGPGPVPTTVSTGVAHALMGHGRPRSTEAVAPAVLRERVETAWRAWQQSSTRFTWAAAELPSLVADMEHAVRAHRRGSDETTRRETLRAAADLYGLLRSYCRRSGRLDLAILSADRAVRAAEDADDPIRMAAAQWNLAHVLLSQPDAAPEAAAVAETAAIQLAELPEDSDQQALTGALHLVQGIAAAQQRRWWDAREHVDRALVVALRVGEGSNVQHTVFGPTNTALHRLSIEMLAGQAGEALRVADHTETTALPSRERQFTFTLDVARCYDLRRDDAAVLVHLLALEDLSTEDFRRSAPAIEMATALHLRVRPTYRPQVAALLTRLNLLP